jgi:hypothetical protein
MPYYTGQKKHKGVYHSLNQRQGNHIIVGSMGHLGHSYIWFCSQFGHGPYKPPFYLIYRLFYNLRTGNPFSRPFG